MKQMIGLWIISGVGIWLVGWFVSGTCLGQNSATAQVVVPDVPPGERWEGEGIQIEHARSGRSLGLTAHDLLRLAYDAKEIPNYTLAQKPVIFPYETKPRHHTLVVLNVGSHSSLCSRLGRVWVKVENLEAFQKQVSDVKQHLQLLRERGATDLEYTRAMLDADAELGKLFYKDMIDMELRVFDRSAAERGYTLEQYRQHSSSMRFRSGTPSGLPLGEDAWYLPPTTIFCSTGRVFFTVTAPDLELAETLAVGIMYRLGVYQPKLVAVGTKRLTVQMDGRPIDKGQVVQVGGMVLAPLSLLEAVGAQVEPRRNEQEWQATVRYGDRWVQARVLSQELQGSTGRIRLPCGVFGFGEALIVPLQSVAEALGLKMEARGTVITISK